jgi:hypothetical protein
MLDLAHPLLKPLLLFRLLLTVSLKLSQIPLQSHKKQPA